MKGRVLRNVEDVTMNCNKPDRHQPKLICGYPLPCPYHTIVIDLKKKKPENKLLRRLDNIKQALEK